MSSATNRIERMVRVVTHEPHLYIQYVSFFFSLLK